jgi:predicted lipid-binding transport protein (Tim44 family)
VARGVAVPADFEVEEFLDGARMLYSRLQTSWAARDLEDLAPFATPEMLDILRRQAEQDPTPGNVDVLLVTAVLTGIIRREEEERVTVAFSAILQENSTDRNQDEKISVNEIWHFVRSPATGGGWRLDGIEQAP